MKIKKGFELKDVCGTFIIIAHGRENIDFTKMITFNQTAADVWNGVKDMEEFTVEDMAKVITEQYEVDNQTATKDAANLAQMWIDNEIVDK